MSGVLDRLDAALVDGVGVPPLEVLAQGLVEHLLAPEALQDDRRRHAPLAKTRNAHLVGEMPERVLEIVLDTLCRHLDVEACAVTFEKGCFGPHWSQTVAEHPASSVGRHTACNCPATMDG